MSSRLFFVKITISHYSTVKVQSTIITSELHYTCTISIMQYTQLISILLSLTMAPWAMAEDCQNTGGVANGECVTVYTGQGCEDFQIEARYKPTCEGNCFVMGFSSLHVAGDGTFGTDCIAYSDTNCQVEMSDTGNIATGPGVCRNFPNAQSQKCFYRC